MINILLVEDEQVALLAPATTARPAWSITCGSFRLIDLLQTLEAPVTCSARLWMQELALADEPALQPSLDSSIDTTLVVNARLAPTASNLAELKMAISQSAADGKTTAWMAGPSVAIALVDTKELISSSTESPDPSRQRVTRWLDARTLPESCECRLETDFRLLSLPHDIIDCQMQSCGNNIELRLLGGNYQRLADGVYVSKKSPAKIPSTAVFDASDGPIVIDAGCRIGPFTFFRGPVYIGPNSKISEHASIKDSVSIGHTCKIGGEVEGVVVEPFSNKQHYGFLGHAWLGSWINLGAGTCNSDLKNTYGMVNMQVPTEIGGAAKKVDTKMQFVGCLIGDYAKTAINTSIYTGKTIGVGSMVYGDVTTNVPPFVNYAHCVGQSSSQIGVLPADVTVTTQQRMFGRRGKTPRPCDVRLIREMFDRTESQRDSGWSSDPIAL